MNRLTGFLCGIFLPGALILGAAAAMAYPGADQAGQPTDAKARKSFAQAIAWQQHGNDAVAADSYRKANQQDGFHCAECLQRAYSLAMKIGNFKLAQTVVEEALPAAGNDPDRATMHFQIGMAGQGEGVAEKKAKFFAASCDEFKTALALDPKFAGVHYPYGVSLAYLHQDDAARAEFKTYLDQDRESPVLHLRAQRFVDRVELARARMAPAFEVTTLDGQRVSMDSLAGKVVLIDFWATWCGPCRQALPDIRRIVQKFQGQPFVALSISLDSNEADWKKFVASNQMTWLQYRDRGKGEVADQFGVHAIPATFSIDADGVLEDQHVGDTDIEGKLKKMIAQAVARQNEKTAAEPAPQAKSGAQ